jgi:pimeloyl-ACP methyl ester carboxylesterase
VATFCLIHGGCHGAWCWERLARLLEASGHQVIAPELPCEDAAVNLLGLRDRVLEAVDRADPPVLLVAHSLGGLIAPLVADASPTTTIVYLCAVIPEPGHSLADQLRHADGPSTVPREVFAWDELKRVIDASSASELLETRRLRVLVRNCRRGARRDRRQGACH